MEEAQELSDRVGIIDHGELIALGTQADLTRQVGQSETLILHIGEGESAQAIGALVPTARSLDGVLKADSTEQSIIVVAVQAAVLLLSRRGLAQP
jgi:ABC-2 type transport system ATP-binding protein